MLEWMNQYVIAATIVPTCALPSEPRCLKRFHAPAPKQLIRIAEEQGAPDKAALREHLER